MILAELITGISSVQIESGDGLPGSVCLQCVHQISRAYSFKQLCEQSDTNLRQYLGLPPSIRQRKEEEVVHPADFASTLLLDNFGLDSSSGDSDDDDYKIDYNLLQASLSENANDEKAIAQRQLLKAAKSQKSKLSKKKLLAKAGGKAAGKDFISIIPNMHHCCTIFINTERQECLSKSTIIIFL
jgi:hypothetical protein